MKIGLNEKYEIKQIDNITENFLNVIALNSSSDTFPFIGWSNEKILCYCYKNKDGGVLIYPYVNDKKIQEIERQALELQSQVIEFEFDKIGGNI